MGKYASKTFELVIFYQKNMYRLCKKNIPKAFFHEIFGDGIPLVRQSRITFFFKITKESSGSIIHVGGTETTMAIMKMLKCTINWI